MLCHSGGPITPQDRADGPEKDAEDQEGCSNKNVIVNKDSLGEEKSQSRQMQGREPPPTAPNCATETARLTTCGWRFTYQEHT
jgi:hypothetical protein